jgi:hypothetical protein
MLAEILPLTPIANQPGTWTNNRARAEEIAIMYQRDDLDGWQYRVEARGSWYAIVVYDEDGIKLGDL